MRLNKEVPSKEELDKIVGKDTDNLINKSTDYSTEEQINERVSQVVGAWKTVDQVASDVWHGIHERLLYNSELVFAYRSTEPGSDLNQIVVVRNLDRDGQLTDLFSVGMITVGFTALVPRVPKEYLEKNVVMDMEKHKVKRDYIDTFKEIIKNI